MKARLFCCVLVMVLLFTFAGCSDSDDNTCENKILRKSMAEWDNDKDGNIDSIIYYAYDSEGNLLTEETDSDNDGTIDFVTENRYEGSLLKKKIFNEDDNCLEIWEYFYENNRLMRINAEGSYTIISPDKPETDDSFHITYTFVYDEYGNIIAKNAVNPDNGSVDSVFFYEYDSNGNVIKEMIDYNNDGEFESVTVTNYIYDNCGYMTEAHIDIDDDGVIDKSGYYTWE